MEKAKLSRELTDVLRKQVPEHVSMLLREELEAGAKAKEQASELMRDLNLTRDMLDDAKRQVIAQDAFEASMVELTQRENDLAEREARFTEVSLRDQLETANKYSAKLEGLLAGLVRNVEWRRDVFDTFAGPWNSETTMNEKSGSTETHTAD